MAIFPPVEISPQANADNASSAVDIEAWTEQATEALATVAISTLPTIVRGTFVALDIPLDDRPALRPTQHGGISVGPDSIEKPRQTSYVRRGERIRRDSLKRREALLKGKEGSRRRQRWENDRLLHNPHAQPPLPIDWEVRPTYRVHSVPYYLAPLWDNELAARSAAREKSRSQKAKGIEGPSSTEENAARGVPRELREKLKRARAAKGLLQELEEAVRTFVASWEDKQRKEKRRREDDGLDDAHSSDEDEVVFVGRNGAMSDMRSPRICFEGMNENPGSEKMIFDSLEADHAASFGRWLVHNIATYYNLQTWSVTTGNPARREAYVGIKESKLHVGTRGAKEQIQLPRPLWCMV